MHAFGTCVSFPIQVAGCFGVRICYVLHKSSYVTFALEALQRTAIYAAYQQVMRQLYCSQDKCVCVLYEYMSDSIEPYYSLSSITSLEICDTSTSAFLH
jgi:hypothetical protein